jgi:hypothetical protein
MAEFLPYYFLDLLSNTTWRRPLMNPIFQTPYTMVTEANGIITIKRRSGAIYLIAAFEIAIGAMAYLVSRLQLTAAGALERLCFWAAAILIPLAALMILMGVLQGLNSIVIFDCNSRKIRKGSRVYDFAGIDRFTVDSIPFADKELYFLTAAVNQKPIKLVSETQKDSLERMAEYLNQRTAFTESFSAEAASVRLPLAENGPQSGYFLGVLLMVMGAIWSGTGVIFLRNIIITGPGLEHGPLLWALGIWLAAFGLGDMTGIPWVKWLREGPGWLRTLVLIAGFGSYFLVCWR